jgi:hypothetical protein
MFNKTTITTDFTKDLPEGTSVELLNIYKGVPIHIQATVQSVTAEIARMSVLPPESICLALNRSTLIRSNLQTNLIRAKILDFDAYSGSVELGQLHYSSTRFTERTQIRVEPRYMIPVEIESATHRIVGTLADISLDGIGVYITSTGYEYAVKRAETVNLSIRLPGGKIFTEGRVRGTGRSIDYCRLSIHFKDDTPDHAIVQQYIAGRRDEIMAELNGLYQNAVSERKTVHPEPISRG